MFGFMMPDRKTDFEVPRHLRIAGEFTFVDIGAMQNRNAGQIGWVAVLAIVRFS